MKKDQRVELNVWDERPRGPITPEDLLKAAGIRTTRQREIILRHFLRSKRHMSLEELYQESRREDPRIAFTTVYRTLKALTDKGMVAERHFEYRQTVFEPWIHRVRHDHFICRHCGLVVELHGEKVDVVQEEIAKEQGFVVERRRLEMYGRCAQCSRIVREV